MSKQDMSRIVKAFRKQNPALTSDLTKAEWKRLKWYAEHHSGGLLVAGEYVDSTITPKLYVKMHDTWGDPADPNEGPIVVHLYDADDDGLNGAADVCLYFTSGVAALDLFLNEPALAQIWKVTR
jgi:hypothetical protein